MKYIIRNGEGTKNWHASGELLGIWQRQQLSKQYGSGLKKSTYNRILKNFLKKKKLSHLIYVAFLWSMNLSWPADPTKTTAFFPKQALPCKVLALKMPLGYVDQEYTVLHCTVFPVIVAAVPIILLVKFSPKIGEVRFLFWGRLLLNCCWNT